MKNKPVLFRYKEVDITFEGRTVRAHVMIPHQRFRQLCDRQFELEEDYPLARIENRSMASHNYYFAALSDAFDNLPEAWAQEFPSAEHMRKWVLIEVGFFTIEEHDFDTAKDAKKFAALIRKLDEYARIKIVGTTVMIRRAKSQDHRSMKKEEFEASKSAVLEYTSQVIGVKREQLESAAAQRSPPRRLPAPARQLPPPTSQGEKE